MNNRSLFSRFVAWQLQEHQTATVNHTPSAQNTEQSNTIRHVYNKTQGFAAVHNIFHTRRTDFFVLDSPLGVDLCLGARRSMAAGAVAAVRAVRCAGVLATVVQPKQSITLENVHRLSDKTRIEVSNEPDADISVILMYLSPTS